MRAMSSGAMPLPVSATSAITSPRSTLVAIASQPPLGPPNLQDVVTYGDYEVATQRIATTQLGEPIYVQYGEAHANVDATINRLWLLLGLGVLGGSWLALLAGLAVAGRAMSPIASLTSSKPAGPRFA